MDEDIEFLGKDFAFDQIVLDDLSINGQFSLLKTISDCPNHPKITREYAEVKKHETAERISKNRIFDGLELFEAMCAIEDESIHPDIRLRIASKLNQRLMTIKFEYEQFIGENDEISEGTNQELIRKIDPCNFTVYDISCAVNSLLKKINSIKQTIFKESNELRDLFRKKIDVQHRIGIHEKNQWKLRAYRR